MGCVCFLCVCTLLARRCGACVRSHHHHHHGALPSIPSFPSIHHNGDDDDDGKVAGLCHDLGHGPLSHGFDQFVTSEEVNDTDWTHEKGSLMMLDHLIRSNPGM